MRNASIALFVVFLSALPARSEQNSDGCAKAKILAAVTHAKCLLTSEAKAAGSGVEPNPDRAQQCHDRAARAFDRIEANGGCGTSADEPRIEGLVTRFANEVSSRLIDCVGVPQPAVAPGVSPAGYIPLSAFGIVPTPAGDNQIINLTVPPYIYNGVTYTQLGVSPNGYAIAGGGAGDVDEIDTPQSLPDYAQPNAILAPLWADLDGTSAPGIFAGTLTDGVNTWIVIEWQVNEKGTTSLQKAQTWIGLNGVQDISYTYDPADLPDVGGALTVGAESELGCRGASIAGLPTEDLVVTSTP